jgi:hypothetical protein
MQQTGPGVPRTEVPSWTFLSNHAHVLVCIAQDPEIRMATISRLVGIGERATHAIVHDLIDAGYVKATKVGRHNMYAVDLNHPLRHPLEAKHTIAELFAPLTDEVDNEPESDPDS